MMVSHLLINIILRKMGDNMFYSSTSNSKIKELAKLKNKKYRDSNKLFLIEGKHLVMEAYKSGCLKEILLLEGLSLDIDIPINYISENVLKYLSSLHSPSGIIGVCEIKENDLKGDKLLLLDNIQDPGNLGTIIRSAVAFNIDTIVTDKCVDVYSDKVVRSSQGMIFKVNVVNKDIKEVIGDIKGDIPIYGTKVNGGNLIKNVTNRDKFAIIMGNEGQGVSKDILDLCDEYLYIPMNGECESLNVGVATSIILYEFVR